VLQFGVGVLVLGYVLSLADLERVGDLISDANAGLLVLAVLLNIPIAGLFGVRAQLVLRALGYTVPSRVGVPVAVIGNVAGALTPLSAGELLRALLLRSHADIRTDDAVVVVLFERAASLYLLVVSTGVAAAYVFLAPYAFAACVAAAAVLMIAPTVAARVPGNGTPNDTEAGYRARLRASTRSVVRLFSASGLIARWWAITLGVFGLTALQYWLVARSVADGVDFGESWTAYGASQLAAIASLLPLGIGSGDGSLAAILDGFGTTFDEGAAAAVLLRAASTLPLVIIAGGAYPYLRWSDRHGRAGEAGAQLAGGD
jgi:uncharacterized membrane protein YbhN (UPF0104 family)